MIAPATLADLPAFRIGHAQDAAAATGCTVIVAPAGASCGVAVRGGGPATRETDLLRPENMIEAVHAVVLAGGSAFGLEASCGVMDALAERGIGFQMAGACVPIVTGACLFDLLVGAPAHPDKAMGREAAERALADGYDGAAVAQGNVGAGTGATVGKLAAPEAAMKAGLGWSALRLGDLVVAALVAVNALGCVRDSQGRWVAGVVGPDGRVADPLEVLARGTAAQAGGEGGPVANTTLGVVLTNARLTKAHATKVASLAHDAYARAIKPVHTMNDGDTVFVFASGEVEAGADVVGVLGAEAMEQAILSAVMSAEGAYGLPAARDLA
ncbi:MAG: P1 family peptidase [Eggerthellaceae bacterium]|nr:P1 family peptidase [Eggerthellaceae bacterium]